MAGTIVSAEETSTPVQVVRWSGPDQYNTVRLHEGIGYVTPDDVHDGRGPAIRQARRDELERARVERISYHRTHKPPEPGNAD